MSSRGRSPTPRSESTDEAVVDPQSQGDEVDDIDLDDFEDDTQASDYSDNLSALEGLLASTLTTPEGDTVCSALVQMARQMEIQNKILIKLLNSLQKKNEA